MKKILMIFLVVILMIVMLSAGWYLGYKNYLNKQSQNLNDSTSNTDEKNNEEVKTEDDIYGYAIMSYYSNDGTFASSDKLVELHKNSDDKIIIGIDIEPNFEIPIDYEIGISDFDIVDNKLYYVIKYNGESIYDYSKLMYIDLKTKDDKPKEVLSTKDLTFVDKSCRTFNQFKVVDNIIYIISRCGNFYQYDTNTDQFKSIENDDYPLGDDVSSNYSWNIESELLYVGGKELIIDKNTKELIYDGKTIYTSNGSYLNIMYSFNNEIIISERSDCTPTYCETEKYLKYNELTNTMEEIDEMSNKIYNSNILYKKY